MLGAHFWAQIVCQVELLWGQEGQAPDSGSMGIHCMKGFLPLQAIDESFRIPGYSTGVSDISEEHPTSR